MNKTAQPAAFYDLEGTLVSTNLVHTLAFYAKRQQGLWQTAKKSVGTLTKLPFFGITDLYSRNFSWGTSLAGLSGRAGMNAGFGMSYNSLVWTKQGTAVYFDTNADNISPGFRFGFPVIEPVYYYSATQKFNYMMVTPSGGSNFARRRSAAHTRRPIRAMCS